MDKEAKETVEQTPAIKKSSGLGEYKWWVIGGGIGLGLFCCITIVIIVAVIAFGGGTSSKQTYGPLDPNAEPNYGSVRLDTGFPNDPYRVEMTSGGSIDVDDLNIGSGCYGYAAASPDFSLTWRGSTQNLRFFFSATMGGDTTLLINTPDDRWLCNDDAPYGSLDPLIDISNPANGRYDIWVGSYSYGDFVAGFLTITESDLRP